MARADASGSKLRRLLGLQQAPGSNRFVSDEIDLRELKDQRVRDLIRLAPVTDPFEALATYLAIGWAAGRVLMKGGFFEDAARKYLRLLETVVGFLSWFQMVDYLESRHAGARATRYQDPQDASWLRLLGDVHRADRDKIVNGLLTMGRLLIEEAEALYHRERQDWTPEGAGEVGTRLPTLLAVFACRLGLSAAGLKSPSASDDPWENLSRRIGHWIVPQGAVKQAGPLRERFRSLLSLVMERNAYPLIGRLYGLKILLDDAVVSNDFELDVEETQRCTEAVERFERAKKHLAELIVLEDLYDSKWHFTPFQIGSTLALWCLQPRIQCEPDVKGRRGLGESPPPFGELVELARRRLLEGQEMFSMRRAYYRSINRLFYLHDDFNDRRIHYNHAVQMATAELSHVMLAMLNRKV